MSGDSSDQGRVSLFAVAAGVVVCLWCIGQRGYAVEVGVATLVIYAALCVFHPMAKCTRCEGGKIWNGKRTHFRWCKKCDESKGYHLRWGRRMWDKRMTGD